MTAFEPEYFVKVKGDDYAMGAINLDRSTPGWLMFDRVNTKTGEMIGRFELNLTEIASIEKR